MKNKLISGLGWNFGNRIIANTIQLAVYFLLAKLLTPEDFGAVAIVMIVINIGKVLTSSGLGASIIQEKEFSEKKFIILQTLSLIFGLTGMVFLILVSPLIDQYFTNFNSVKELLLLASPIILFSALFSIQSSLLIKELNFKSLFVITVIPSFISGIISILLAYQGFGASTLILNSLLALIISVIYLSLKFRHLVRLDFEFQSVNSSILFSGNIILINLIEEAYKALYTFFVGIKFGDRNLGLYNFGRQLPGYFALTVNAALSTIIFPTFSKQSLKEKVKTYGDVLVYSISFYVPLILNIFLFAEDILLLLFGTKWIGSLPYIYIFSLIFGLHNLHYNYTQFLNSEGRSNEALKFETSKKIISIVIFLITINKSLIIVAYGQLISSIIMVVYTYLISYIKYGFSYIKDSFKILKIIFFNLLSFVILYFSLSLIEYFLIKIFIVLVVYIPILLLFYKHIKAVDLTNITLK